MDHRSTRAARAPIQLRQTAPPTRNRHRPAGERGTRGGHRHDHHARGRLCLRSPSRPRWARDYGGARCGRVRGDVLRRQAVGMTRGPSTADTGSFTTMIVAAPLLVMGLAAGYWIRRWILVVAVILIGLTTSLSGWLTGWAASPDTPAAGGAIILAIYLWLPLALGTSVGVHLGRAKERHRRP